MTTSDVTTSGGPSTSHLSVKGTVPSSVPMGQGSGSVGELMKKMAGGEEAIKKIMEGKAEKLVQKIKLIGSHYKARAICKSCGWQTFQFDEGQAADLVKQHALAHWMEVAEQEVTEQAAGDGK